jgi:hypothetical protein
MFEGSTPGAQAKVENDRKTKKYSVLFAHVVNECVLTT